MSVIGSAPALDPNSQQPERRQGIRVWLCTWYHVLIAELLHLLEDRRDSPSGR
jgi:hypothetical protein